MNEVYTYHGHSIDLNLKKLACGFQWTYFIDSNYCMQGLLDAFDVEDVRNSALVCAHQSIDALEGLDSVKKPGSKNRLRPNSSGFR